MITHDEHGWVRLQAALHCTRCPPVPHSRHNAAAARTLKQVLKQVLKRVAANST